MARRKRRGGVPWRALVVVCICSLAAGYELAQMQHGVVPRHRIAVHHMVHPPLYPHVGSNTSPRGREGRVASDVRPAPVATTPSAATQSPESRPSVPMRPAAAPSPAGTAPVPRPSFSVRPGEARLAIIIDDCGQWLATEKALVALPIPVTVSIMPDAPYTAVIERAAADAGQGVMLHLPMEPRATMPQAKGEVTTAMDDAAIQQQVRDDLARVPLARGVNNHEGSKATADPRVMHDVAVVLAAEGRYFIDSRTTAATVAAKETQAENVPTASRNVFLDDEPSVTAVEEQLLHAAEVARSRGRAIAIGHPNAAVLAALRAEIPRIEDGGVTFTLVQNLVE